MVRVEGERGSGQSRVLQGWKIEDWEWSMGEDRDRKRWKGQKDKEKGRVRMGID